MSAKTDYLENEIINYVLRNDATAFLSPTTVYVGLFNTAPGEAGGGIEVSGGAYARQPVAFKAPSNGVTQNAANVSFPLATTGWGTITHFAFFDALVDGEMLYYGILTPSQNIDQNEALKFLEDDLIVQEF